MIDLSGITTARGLYQKDQRELTELVNVLKRNEPKHEKRRKYYYDKVKPRNLGMRIPQEFCTINSCLGWASKAVNSLSERSVFDSFTFAEGDHDEFFRCVEENDISGLYSMADTSMLIDGCGFWSVMKGEEGEPKAVVNFHDGETAAALWNYRKKRISCALIVADYDMFPNKSWPVPSLCYLHNDNYIVKIERSGESSWSCQYINNPMGVPMVVPMVYKRSNAKPFGKSRISPAVMGHIDSAMEEIVNMAVQSNYFSIPQKYALGLSENAVDQLAEDMHRAYKADMFVATPNDDGQIPTFGMLQGASMEPHIAVLDKLANFMAAETNLPVTTFGVSNSVYTSNDSLRAANDEIVILAKAMNKENGKALSTVAKMMMAVIGEKSIRDLTPEESSVSVHFLNPAMPSDSQTADSVIKIVSAVPDFAGSPVFWERLNFSDDEVVRIDKYMSTARTSAEIKNALFGEQ